MAVIKGTTAPTKGNPRPATKPPTAKPLVPAKPLVAAGTGGMGSERNALKRSNPITTPTQMLNPGTRLPLTPNQGSRLINPSVGAPSLGPVKPLPTPTPAPLGAPGSNAFPGLRNTSQQLAGRVQAGAQDFWRQLWQGMMEMGEEGPVSPLKRQ